MAALVTPTAASAALVSELMAQGRKSAAAVEALLHVQDHAGIRELTAEILRCCDHALAALNGDAGRNKRKSAPDGGAATQTKSKRRTRGRRGETTATPTRVERKQNWDDGFVWRKYGEKNIRGSVHPRHYFRCAYRLHAGGCPARRQVQRSDDHDPPLYVITYFGDHTCCHGADAIAVLDDVKIQRSVVVDFGSAGGCSPRPDDGGARSGKTSRSEELATEVAKVESTPLSDLGSPAGQVAELSSSADDVRCSSSSASAAWDPSAAVCSTWDYFGDYSFDYVISEFFGFEDIALYR